MEIQEGANKSVKRKKIELKTGDQVLLKDVTRKSKFEPVYYRKQYTVLYSIVLLANRVLVTGPEGVLGDIKTV